MYRQEWFFFESITFSMQIEFTRFIALIRRYLIQMVFKYLVLVFFLEALDKNTSFFDINLNIFRLIKKQN